jgi:hypothetical protein
MAAWKRIQFKPNQQEVHWILNTDITNTKELNDCQNFECQWETSVFSPENGRYITCAKAIFFLVRRLIHRTVLNVTQGHLECLRLLILYLHTSTKLRYTVKPIRFTFWNFHAKFIFLGYEDSIFKSKGLCKTPNFVKINFELKQKVISFS